MADKVQEHDKQVLHKMGYAQELARRMSLFSNFAISFSIICILAGGISAFPAAFSATGSGGAVISWLVGGAIAMVVAFGMGQIASSYPTAGGLYHWSSFLGGKAWGWATAWFNLVGLICVVSSVDVLLYTVFFKDLLLGSTLGIDVSTFGYWHQFFFVAAVLIAQALFNHYGIQITTKLTDLSGYLILALTVILLISLFAFSPVASISLVLPPSQTLRVTRVAAWCRSAQKALPSLSCLVWGMFVIPSPASMPLHTHLKRPMTRRSMFQKACGRLYSGPGQLD